MMEVRRASGHIAEHVADEWNAGAHSWWLRDRGLRTQPERSLKTDKASDDIDKDNDQVRCARRCEQHDSHSQKQ